MSRSDGGREAQSAKDTEKVIPRVKRGEPGVISARAVVIDKKDRALARLGPRGNVVKKGDQVVLRFMEAFALSVVKP